MARTGLGRGLDVLLGQPASGEQAPALPAPTELPLELVRPNRQQPRTTFDPESLSELAASIRAHGVLQPIVVSQDGDGYELIAGHRRVFDAAADEQLGHHRRNAASALQRHDPGGVMRVNAPALGHIFLT